MKILTKKKQEKILELLIESGVAIAKDSDMKMKTYHKVYDANYAIADLVGGMGFNTRYFTVIDRVIDDELAKMGE